MPRQTPFEALLANTADSLKLWQEASELQRRSAEAFLDPNLGALPLRLGDLQARTFEFQARVMRLHMKAVGDSTRWLEAFGPRS